MTIPDAGLPLPLRPLRLWPGVAAVAVQWLLWLFAALVFPGQGAIGIIGGVVCGLVVVAWWLFFSRAPWPERLGAIALMVIVVAATSRLVHPSIANGMMGMLLPIYAIPAMCLALVAALLVGRHLSSGRRRTTLVALVLLAGGVFTLIRTAGMTGEGDSDLHWRWTPSPEDRLLAQAADESAPLPSGSAAAAAPTPVASAAGVETPPSSGDGPAATAANPGSAAEAAKEAATPATAPAALSAPAAWPGFRGPDRDGHVSGVRIATDWATSPPVQLWRRPVGPGWSSFAVRGDRIYTQEQRGEEEIVACYRLGTGALLWRHRDPARFWESNAGAGPRGTPTLDGSRVYTFGATGILNALDAATGAVVWSRNAAQDTSVPIPGWGFASSPLVVGDHVIVAISGVLAAYDVPTGAPRWVSKADGGGGYSSPHLATIDGVAQVLLMAGDGVRSVAPADGALLWAHAWPGAPIVQPALVDRGDVLISTAGSAGALGMRRLAVTHAPGGWTVAERWTSNRLKPYFNDFVVHKGHAYGFDGFILAAISLGDGERKWKGGRYGNGQLLLLPEQDLLLVLSEEGELALVSATPEKFTELGRFPALAGKTWNHPVLAGDVLLVRNGEEMAAFRLPVARR